MAQVNYHLARRKRELEKKQKQEAKRLRKAERKLQQHPEASAPPPSV